MAGFLYFVPGEHGVLELAEVQQLGLGYAFDIPPTCARSEGPEGETGLLCCRTTHSAGLTFDPHNQEWREVEVMSNGIPRGSVWVGMLRDNPPAPTHLERAVQLTGDVLQLDDGHYWRIPKARNAVSINGHVEWYTVLPRLVDCDKRGQPTPGDIVTKYRDFYDATNEFLDAMVDGLKNHAGDNDLAVAYPGLTLGAVTTLQANYHVGPIEIGLLKALSEQTVGQVMSIALDLQTYIDYHVKKKPQHDAVDLDGGATAGALADTRRDALSQY